MSCGVNLWVGNNNVLQLGTTADPLTNSITGTVDTGATVTATIYEMDGTEVTGETWPAVMSHAGSGIYRATLDPTMNLVSQRHYNVVISATGSGGEVGLWTVKVLAITREAT